MISSADRLVHVSVERFAIQERGVTPCRSLQPPPIDVQQLKISRAAQEDAGDDIARFVLPDSHDAALLENESLAEPDVGRGPGRNGDDLDEAIHRAPACSSISRSSEGREPTLKCWRRNLHERSKP
ncbi:MAG: hypothetical protein Q8L14_09645 [Myxococcales bacterium]|nr:hypothetical protein [Myxococcales bacterium]